MYLLSAAVSEWAAQFQSRLASDPARGATAVEQLIDVLRRASRAIEGRPLFTAAVIRALSSSTPGVATAAARVRAQVVEVTTPCLVGTSPAEIEGIVSVLWHVWHSTLITWANGGAPISTIGTELETAARLLLARGLDWNPGAGVMVP
jgi:Tetracyclin repressor-like, C-terminal domain